MTRSSLLLATGLVAATALIASVSGGAVAAPLGFASGIVASATNPLPIVDIRARARQRVRRGSNGAPVAAVLGLFGAALGAAVASDRYNNYSYGAYGYPGGYGYAPGYGYSPGYGVAPSYGFGNQGFY